MTLSTRLSLALAPAPVGLGCNTPPAPATPATAATPAGVAAPAPAGPRIVGTVVTNPPTAMKGGGLVYLEDGPKKPGAGMTASVDVRDKAFSCLLYTSPSPRD